MKQARSRVVAHPGRALASGTFSFLAMMLTTMVLDPASPVCAEQDQPGRAVAGRGAERTARIVPRRIDGDLRDLPRPNRWAPGNPVREIRTRSAGEPGPSAPFARGEHETRIDPLTQRQSEAQPRSGSGSTVLNRNFPGAAYAGAGHPDTGGDVGPDHYIQVVSDFRGSLVSVYDKAEPTPNLLTQFVLDTLDGGDWACADGDGYPVVLYDRYAERWILAEVADTGSLCFYISQTADPVTGGWLLYPFLPPPSELPSQPKYAVWPTDANGGQGSYISTAHETNLVTHDEVIAAYAIDRAAVLAGAPATLQRETFPLLPGFGFQTATPADPDGPDAPAMGDPAIFMRHRDAEIHDGSPVTPDRLEMWTWQVDWLDAQNSVLTQQPAINVSEFDSTLCGQYFNLCFPQPGSVQNLNPEREAIMWPLQYMNHGEFETLVGNFVTDVDGNDHGGLRWFELRRTDGGAWALFQEGTYSIDSAHRWMGASAMDQAGNIAIGYDVVAPDATYPSLRYTGRLADDPSGVMSQPETSIHDGTAANGSYRYGRHSAISLDPEDDCTFWFTGQNNTSSLWRTQIASFRFDVCGCEQLPLPPSTSPSISGENRVQLDWSDSEMDTIVEYRILRSRGSGGPYEPIDIVPDSSPGLANGPPYSWEDGSVSGNTTYAYVVVASDGAACRSERTNEVEVTATGACTLAPVFDGLQSVSEPFSDACRLDLAWNPGAAECGAPIAYNVYRSTTAGFVPGPGNLLAGGIAGTTLSDTNSLVGGAAYHYRVRAVDLSNGAEDDNARELSGAPKGAPVGGNWFDDAGDTGAARMTTNSPWHVDALLGHDDPRVYKTGKFGTSGVCAGLITPPLHLRTDGTLSFWSQHDINAGRDKGEVQISTDGGFSWERVPMAYPGVSTYDSDGCGLPEGFYFTGTDPAWTQYAADLAAWGDQDVRLRFLLSTSFAVSGDGWWIDDITVTQVDLPGVCSTPLAPLPAPDGSGATTPLRGERSSPSGDTIEVTWDAVSCSATDYNLLYGELADVASYTSSGSVCSIGTSGIHSWTGVPAGDLYFIVVGHDGQGTESSWGFDSLGTERNGSASGECSTVAKNVSATCP